MPRKKTRKIITLSDRKKILAEAKAKGLTAEQVARKYKISKWTYYGWKKRTAKPATAKTRKSVQPKTAAVSSKILRSEIRAVLPGILREELARALGTIIKKRTR